MDNLRFWDILAIFLCVRERDKERWNDDSGVGKGEVGAINVYYSISNQKTKVPPFSSFFFCFLSLFSFFNLNAYPRYLYLKYNSM